MAVTSPAHAALGVEVRPDECSSRVNEAQATYTMSTGRLGVTAGYRLSDVGAIPCDWSCARLGDDDLVTRVGSGITPTGGQRVYKPAGRPFVRSQNVGWGKLLLEDLAYIDDATHGSFAASEIETGDVLLNITGASIGRCAVATAVIAGGNVNQHVCEIRVDPSKLNARFLSSFILSEPGQKQIESFQAGGNRQGLNFGQVRALRLPLPSVTEQEAIAEALSDLDDLLGALDALIAKKRAIKQAAMQQLLTGKTRLPGFSGDWTPGFVGDVVSSLIAGVSVNSIDAPTADGVPSVLKTSALTGGVFLPDEAKVIQPRDISRARTNPERDTILISRMNTPNLVGEIAYVDRDYDWLFLPDRIWMARFSARSKLNVRWLAYVLSSPIYRDLLREVATGTSGSMKNISKAALLATPVEFPSWRLRWTFPPR